MGVVPNIQYNRFPDQGSFLGKVVDVCFHYDTEHVVPGRVVRDDAQSPSVTLIQLVDRRIVLGTECQYSPPKRLRDA